MPPSLLAHRHAGLVGGAASCSCLPWLLSLIDWLQLDKAAAHSGGSDRARSTSGQQVWPNTQECLHTKQLCGNADQSQWILQYRLFHSVCNEIINQICGGCGIKCLEVFLSFFLKREEKFKKKERLKSPSRVCSGPKLKVLPPYHM